jgi:hypothetical protein
MPEPAYDVDRGGHDPPLPHPPQHRGLVRRERGQFPPAAIDAGLRQAVATEDPEILYVPTRPAASSAAHGPYGTGSSRTTYRP